MANRRKFGIESIKEQANQTVPLIKSNQKNEPFIQQDDSTTTEVVAPSNETIEVTEHNHQENEQLQSQAIESTTTQQTSDDPFTNSVLNTLQQNKNQKQIKVGVHFYVPPELRDWLKKFAFEQNMSMNEVFTILLTEFKHNFENKNS